MDPSRDMIHALFMVKPIKIAVGQFQRLGTATQLDPVFKEMALEDEDLAGIW
jgi:hypothetical protein